MSIHSSVFLQLFLVSIFGDGVFFEDGFSAPWESGGRGVLNGWVVPYGKATGRGGGKASWEGAEI